MRNHAQDFAAQSSFISQASAVNFTFLADFPGMFASTRSIHAVMVFLPTIGASPCIKSTPSSTHSAMMAGVSILKSSSTNFLLNASISLRASPSESPALTATQRNDGAQNTGGNCHFSEAWHAILSFQSTSNLANLGGARKIEVLRVLSVRSQVSVLRPPAHFVKFDFFAYDGELLAT